MDLLKSKEFEDFLNNAKQNENILACILYGSYVKNKQKESSDLDICIIKKDISKIEEFEDLFGYEDIDLVFFHNLTDVVKFNVLTEGKILILNDSNKFKEIRRKVTRSYFDFYSTMQRQYERMLANV